VPIDLGGIVTGITTGASHALRARLGIDGPDAIADRAQQLAQPHPAILERLGVDTRYLYRWRVRVRGGSRYPGDLRHGRAQGPDGPN